MLSIVIDYNISYGRNINVVTANRYINTLTEYELYGMLGIYSFLSLIINSINRHSWPIDCSSTGEY